MKKKLFRGFSEIVRNDENAFLRLGWWVYNLLIIGLSCKKVLLVLNTQYSILKYSKLPYGFPKVY